MALRARRLTVVGQVQGVGFRPFVYRLAQRLGLRGWVRNETGRVEILIEGPDDRLATFRLALIEEAPPLAAPRLTSERESAHQALSDFRILESDARDAPDIHLPVDHFVCDDCLAELSDPTGRRYRYPFTNCTQCGPRYTLIQALPYDRANTAMAAFELCPACEAEYTDPLDRRFHAEPIACPICGPHLQWVSRQGEPPASATAGTTRDHQQNGGRLPVDASMSDGDLFDTGALEEEGLDAKGTDDEALAAAVKALEAGAILAVKGIGGYHLLCDAQNEKAIARLRAQKPRPRKPLAVMFADLEGLHQAVISNPEQDAFLSSAERPILLLPKRHPSPVSDLIAPNLAEIGCLLPYSPLHALLLADFGRPLVATSGNLSGEPVLTEPEVAETRLAHVADAWLHHDRPILRPADDSVYRPIAGKPRPLRLGRGRAPVELELPGRLDRPVLALGSHMKNTLCLAWDNRALISPHIGELDSARSLDTLAQVAEDLQRLYQVSAERLLVDRHPGYGYRRFARTQGLAIDEIWHHQAHASALAWEFPQVPDWILFTWDGVGLGMDGSLWGGEAFIGHPGDWRHAAGLHPFRLPGGDKAGRQPWRSAAALLWETGREWPVDWPLTERSAAIDQQAVGGSARHPENSDMTADLTLLHQAWQRGLNAPQTTAAGRLFDAAAALIGCCREASFEGEGPMRLEALAASHPGSVTPIALPLTRDQAGIWRSDWSVLIEDLMDTDQSQAERAALFHQSLAQALVAQALQLRGETGIDCVGLTGGVFQNRLLAEQSLALLREQGFQAYLPARLPVNDAAISFGQVMEWLALQESADLNSQPT